MNSIKVTIKKELRSIIRDKKTFLTLLIMPLIGIFFVIIYGFIFEESGMQSSYDIGINFEPTTVEKIYFSEYELITHKYETLEEMKKAYNNKEISAYIEYNKENKKYYYYTNNSQEGYQLQTLIYTYFETIKSNELITYIAGEGIDYEEVVSKYDNEYIELKGPDYFLTTIYSSLFMLIFTGIISTSQSMAISTTVTEKESGTLETILSFPISKKNLILGKYLANFIASAIASVIEFASILTTLIISKNFFSVMNSLEISVDFSNVLIGLVICIISALLISALSTLLVATVKTAKEGQIKLSFLQYLSMIPMFANILNITTSSPLFYSIPIMNSVQILMDIFLNNTNLINILTTILSSIVLSILTIIVIIKKYNQEKVLFGE